MKKLIFSVIVFVGVFCLLSNHSSQAYTATNNRLIDDSIFDNTGTMNASQIDAWLNGFPSSCISPNSGFKAADPTGYTPFFPFVDGKYTYGAPVTAGQVIYDAAIAHRINPQVLLTKLQNEEQLVDGSVGCDNWRYTSAVGYACTDGGTNTHNYTYTGADPYASGAASSYSLNDSTDLVTPLYYRNGVAVNSITGSCVNANVKAGFSEQVVHTAWLLSFSRHKSEGQTDWAAVGGNWNHCEDNDTCAASFNIPDSWACYSGFMTQGNFKRCPTDASAVAYDGYAAIDGQSIHMDTGGTAAFYVYTPHIQSFATIFGNWFGSSVGCGGVNMPISYGVQFWRAKNGYNPYFIINSGTAEGCVEVHGWNGNFSSWVSHIATNQASIDPQNSEIRVADLNGDGRPEFILIGLAHTGSGMIEFHIWDPSLQKWTAHIASNQPVVDPTYSRVEFADLNGDGKDEAVLVGLAHTGSGMVEFHVWNSGMQSWQTHIASNQPAVDPANSAIGFADINGSHHDQAVLEGLRATGSGRVEFHIWNPGMESWQTHIASNQPAVDPANSAIGFADVFGDGRDEAVLEGLHNTGSGNIEFHIWNAGMQTWISHTASNQLTLQ